MAGSLTLKALVFTGLVLLVIGAERLLNVYLVGSGSPSQVRLLVGALCVTIGGLVALAAYVSGRSGRS